MSEELSIIAGGRLLGRVSQTENRPGHVLTLQEVAKTPPPRLKVTIGPQPLTQHKMVAEGGFEPPTKGL